ncbi:MAG: iron-only hydrogenase system regulator [Oscillospiraceae bacterium]|nr:iron-only hydrogenase system regulator [Oscillospiraceae bacterium]
METRVAVIAIIVQDSSSAVSINSLLHEYDTYIIGRMGVPYRCKGISIINIAIDAPQDAINRLAGAIGRLNGVSAKTVYAPAACAPAAEN